MNINGRVNGIGRQSYFVGAYGITVLMRREIDIGRVRRYLTHMIKSFKSKALKKFWERDDASGIRPDWVARIARQLDALDIATAPEDLNIPGFGFHALKADLAGRHAITVSRNWRITFAFEGEDATDIDLEDYHGN